MGGEGGGEGREGRRGTGGKNGREGKWKGRGGTGPPPIKKLVMGLICRRAADGGGDDARVQVGDAQFSADAEQESLRVQPA